MSFSIHPKFFGRFKTGDNINYNLDILSYLYELYDSPGNDRRGLLLKPIITTNIFIIEAILFDFHERVKKNIHEGTEGLSDETLKYIRSKQLYRFEHLIASSKKHGLFGAEDTDFYANLDMLRRARNRIHIQDEKRDLASDEADVFTGYVKVLSEKSLEIIIKLMNKEYSRSERLSRYVNEMVFPWSEHFK